MRACVRGMVDVEGCMVWVGECVRVLFSALLLYVEDWTQYMECFVNIIIITGSRNVVASVSDCRSEDLGFESHQSHNYGIFFIPGWLLPRAGSAMGQWEGWNHTAELHPLHGCFFESVALIT